MSSNVTRTRDYLPPDLVVDDDEYAYAPLATCRPTPASY